MPCNDITEKLKIRLDLEYRLLDYHLTKRTCGGAVGEDSLLLDKLKGQPAETIVALGEMPLFAELQLQDFTEIFIYRKHLSALQTGLEILTGRRDSRFSERFVVEMIINDSDGLELAARVKFSMPAKDIEPCESCGCRIK